ncbi:hypothetical protein [Undibacterium sp. Ren11W]|uniref:hypothetical protein n=1 Tax=Undibacterium sp. Ren11W TaxID=3413045 RepID=UPI003BF279E6
MLEEAHGVCALAEVALDLFYTTKAPSSNKSPRALVAQAAQSGRVDTVWTGDTHS